MHDNKQNNETQTYGKIEKGGFFLRFRAARGKTYD